LFYYIALRYLYTLIHADLAFQRNKKAHPV